MRERRTGNSSPPIFIVGSGRSGTTILLHKFYSHPEVFAPYLESRFLVDTGGLLDLINALSTLYSPSRSREALRRFELMMRYELVSPRSRPYPRIDLNSWFGEDYWQLLNDFCQAITQYSFDGLDHPMPAQRTLLERFAWTLDTLWARARKKELPAPFVNVERVVREPKYFSVREELVELAAEFVATLFEKEAARQGKTHWCEKTPHHLLHLDFILELFPDAKIIHVVRDPRDVVCSYVNQEWAPKSVKDATKMLEFTYRAWFDKKESLPLHSRNYFEFQFETLLESPENTLEELRTFCGLKGSFSTEYLQPAGSSKRAQSQLVASDLKSINELLKPYIESFGYNVQHVVEAREGVNGR